MCAWCWNLFLVTSLVKIKVFQVSFSGEEINYCDTAIFRNMVYQDFVRIKHKNGQRNYVPVRVVFLF